MENNWFFDFWFFEKEEGRRGIYMYLLLAKENIVREKWDGGEGGNGEMAMLIGFLMGELSKTLVDGQTFPVRMDFLFRGIFSLIQSRFLQTSYLT